MLLSFLPKHFAFFFFVDSFSSFFNSFLKEEEKILISLPTKFTNHKAVLKAFIWFFLNPLQSISRPRKSFRWASINFTMPHQRIHFFYLKFRTISFKIIYAPYNKYFLFSIVFFTNILFLCTEDLQFPTLFRTLFS